MTDIGGVVYVPLVEPEKYMSRPASAKYTLPRGFPWTHPVSSNSAVLKPVAVCKEGLVFSGLPGRTLRLQSGWAWHGDYQRRADRAVAGSQPATEHCAEALQAHYHRQAIEARA